VKFVLIGAKMGLFEDSSEISHVKIVKSSVNAKLDRNYSPQKRNLDQIYTKVFDLSQALLRK
jgi:hypothetical protein